MDNRTRTVLTGMGLVVVSKPFQTFKFYNQRALSMSSTDTILDTLKDKQIWKQIKARIKLKKLPIDHIRCQESAFAEHQGFCGKTINHFPPCKFFQLHLDNPHEAHRSFTNWLHYCLVVLETWKMERTDGGWKDGSLIEIIKDVHKENGIDLQTFDAARDDLIYKGIQRKVDYYFQVLRSIQTKGYHIAVNPPITCYQKDGLYYLRGGHHRVSILHVLGEKEARVRVFDN